VRLLPLFLLLAATAWADPVRTENAPPESGMLQAWWDEDGTMHQRWVATDDAPSVDPAELRRLEKLLEEYPPSVCPMHEVKK
jgi:hypothetical protein